MNEEEFKKLRHRFWRIGSKKRTKILLDMGFGAEEWKQKFCDKNDKGEFTNDIVNEVVQRRVLYFIIEDSNGQHEKTLIEMLEIQEEILEAEEAEKAEKTLRVTGEVLGQNKPSQEELKQMKYVPGGTKPWQK